MRNIILYLNKRTKGQKNAADKFVGGHRYSSKMM